MLYLSYLMSWFSFDIIYFFVLEMVMETIRLFAVIAMVLDIWPAIAQKATNKVVTTVANKVT